MRLQTIADTQPVIAQLANTLRQHLADGERVTWLVCGGSSIAIAAMASLGLADTDTSRLSITLTDERFGPVNHPDSNWKQLAEAGFNLPNAHTYPVLHDKELGETTSNYDELLRQLIDQADYSIGLFGMGADGHIAGALPGSPAVHNENFAASYEAPNFTRITMTLKAITHLDEAVLYCIGSEKLPALQQLQTDVPLDEQPAQILKQLPESIVFTDQQFTTGGNT